MTAKDLADYLVRANATTGNAWVLGDVAGSFRRPLLKRRDVLVFTRPVDGNDLELLLQVCELGSRDPAGNPLNVLGEPKLRLKFANPSSMDSSFTLDDGFIAVAYGRTMAFGKSGDRVVYEGIYLGQPHGTPDESGEGEPTIFP